MATLQILAAENFTKVLLDGRELDCVQGFAIGMDPEGGRPLAILYMSPDGIEYEGREQEMTQAGVDEVIDGECGCDCTCSPQITTTLLTGYYKGQVVLKAVQSCGTDHWVASEIEVPLAEFLDGTGIPLSDLAMALAELTQEKR